MLSACSRPDAALLTLLSNHGVLPEWRVAQPFIEARAVLAAGHTSTTGRFEPPDPPPPRA
jgi:hypothetical protein